MITPERDGRPRAGQWVRYRKQRSDRTYAEGTGLVLFSWGYDGEAIYDVLIDTEIRSVAEGRHKSVSVSLMPGMGDEMEVLLP